MLELATNIGFLVSTMGLGALASSPVIMSNASIQMNPANPTSSAIVVTAKKSINEINQHDVNDVAKFVTQYYSDIPILAKVAKCESDMRQFGEDGKVLRGKAVSADVGVMQINEKYHLEASKAMGIDIYTLEGNLKYGRYLYEESGVSAWKASSPCWTADFPEVAAL